MSNPSNFVDVLTSPSVWTGLGGVTSVNNLLSNTTLQDKIQEGLVRSSYNTLVETGQIVIPTGPISAALSSSTGLLGALGTGATSALGSISGLQNSATNLVTGTLGDITGALGPIGSLGSLASLESLGGITGSLGGISLGGITGSLEGALGGITGSLGGALGGITGSLSGALGGITGSLSGALGGALGGLKIGGLPDLGGLLAAAGKFGVNDVLAWAKGKLPSIPGIPSIPGLSALIDSLSKQGQFAVNFSDFKLPAAIAGIVPAAAFAGTIDRSTLNAATSKLIGSDKIPLPKFAPEAISTAPLITLANKAKSLLSGTTGVNNLLAGGLSAGGLLSSASGLLSSSAGGLLSSASGLLSGGLSAGGLLSSASGILATSQSLLSTASSASNILTTSGASSVLNVAIDIRAKVASIV